MKFFTVTTLLLISFTTAFSQAARQKIKIADLQFMAGQWKTSSDWGDMDELLEYAKDPKNGVWIAPVGTVARYVQEKRK